MEEHGMSIPMKQAHHKLFSKANMHEVVTWMAKSKLQQEKLKRGGLSMIRAHIKEDQIRYDVDHDVLHVYFPIQIGDDGLEGLGIDEGDFLIFRHRPWVNGAGEIVFAWIDGEAIVWLAWNIWSETITLAATGGRYPDIHVQRESVIITGVCGECSQARRWRAVGCC